MTFFLTICIDLFITAIAYLFVPVIVCISGKLLTLSQIKKVVIINGLCVWLIFMFIRYEAGIDGTSYAVILWSYVAYSMLKRKCLRQNDFYTHDDTKDNDQEDINVKNLFEENQTFNEARRNKNILTITFSICLAISLICNIILLFQLNNPDYDLSYSYNDASDKLQFYDNNIVFVIDGYGDYYYTYDQMIQVTRNDDYYEYWAYNKDLAIDLGYTAYRR